MLAYRTAQDRPATEAAFAMLSQVKDKGLRRLLISTERFDGKGRVKMQNLNAGYGAEPVALRNVLTRALGRESQGVLADDAMDLLCLGPLLERDGLDAIVLMRCTTDFGAEVRAWLDSPPDLPFLSLGTGSDPTRTTAFRMDHPKLAILVDLSLDMFRSGAVFGLDPYSFDTVLHSAWATAQRL